jgi:hypothetical protein
MNKILYEYVKKILNKQITEKRYILQYHDESFINSITELDDENTKSIFEKELHNIIHSLDISTEYKDELKNLQTEIIVRNKTKDNNYYFN